MKLSDHEQVVLKAIEHVAGSRNGLASVPAVTRAVSYPISTTQKILAALHRKEVIALHHHDFPAQMTADEKKRAVKIGNDYFHAVAIRNPMKRGVAKKNPSPAQLKARAAFTRMAKKRAAEAGNPTKYELRQWQNKFGMSRKIASSGDLAKLIKQFDKLKADRANLYIEDSTGEVVHGVKLNHYGYGYSNPTRARNKAATVSAADIAKMPAHVQAKLRGDLAKVEAKEAKATTPTQKAAAVKARRSFLSRLGTRLRVIGQTRKYKVSARNLNKAPRKTIKIRARHETDAIAKAQAKLGGGFDQFKVQNTVRHRIGNPTFTITATEKGVHLGSFQDKTKTAALKRAKQAYGHRYAGIKATAKNPKRRNGIAKTAGKAIKKVTRAVLGGVSKVAGKGAKALKNPDVIWQVDNYNKTAKSAADEFAGTYWQERRKVRGLKPDGTFKVAGGVRTYRIRKDGRLFVVEIAAANPKRRRNLDHRDSSHQVKVHQHWRAGGLSQWQRAHHAGQHDLFSHGIKAKAKRNPGAFDYYVGAIKSRSLSPVQREHFIQSIEWELSHSTPIQVQRELIKAGMTRKSAGASVRKAQRKIQFEERGIGDRGERAKRKAKAKRPKSSLRRNPSATAIRKKFAGRVSGQKTLYFPKGAPQGMAKLGKFVSVKMKGGKIIKPGRANPTGEMWLCCDTSGKLWLALTRAGAMYSAHPGDLGEMTNIEYEEAKPHLGYPHKTIWFHKLGEVSGKRPHLVVDNNNDLLIKGGNYRITRAGIVD